MRFISIMPKSLVSIIQQVIYLKQMMVISLKAVVSLALEVWKIEILKEIKLTKINNHNIIYNIKILNIIKGEGNEEINETWSSCNDN